MVGFETYNSQIGKIKKEYININDVFANQDAIFYRFLGVFPKHGIRVRSPFRKEDRNPGCRFEWKDGLWWFVDNAGYNGKIYFNAVEVPMHLFGITFYEALQLIAEQITIISRDETPSPSTLNFKFILKFRAKAWERDNYFTRTLDIPISYLKEQPYYSVSDYWANSKRNPEVRKNSIYNPKEVDVISYYFSDSDTCKLYFPGQEIRFLSSCNEDDVFGFHRMGDYLFNSEHKELCFTSSAKDELVLNYHLGLNTLAFQSETFSEIPEKVRKLLKYFGPIYIWMDADTAGYKAAFKLEKLIKKDFPQKKIVIIGHDPEDGKDSSEIYQKDKNMLFYSFKKIMK